MREKEPWAGFDPATSTLPINRSFSTKSDENSGRGSESRPAAFWLEFSDYLQKQTTSSSRQYVKTQLAKAQKYCDVLKTGNATPLLSLSFDQRLQVMKALSSLSKFCGMYEDWQRIRRNYQLKWSDANDGGLRLLAAMTAGDAMTLSSMIDWLRKARSVLPDKYGMTLIYNCLTGLRPTESTMSIKLLQAETPGYLNEKDGLIEHFKFPQLFIRKTKRAYLSILSPQVQEAASTAGGTQNSIRMYLRQRNMEMHAGYMRKIYATWLRQHQVASEIIDLYQGRTPSTVFAQFYYRPDHKQEREKIRGLLGGLLNELL